MYKILWFFTPFILFANQDFKTLYIKGMSCEMCIKTITESLSKANIAGAQIKVGSVILKNEKDINCKVSNAIERTTEYRVFLDKDYKNPACPKS